MVRLIPRLPADFALRPPVAELPYPFGGAHLLLPGRLRVVADAVRALDLPPGSEVLVPDHTMPTMAATLSSRGLMAVPYAAGWRQTDPERLTALATPVARAVLLNHRLGFPEDGAGWRDWCDDHGLLLIEDASTAWLSERDGTPAGSSGHVTLHGLSETLGPGIGSAISGDSVPSRTGRGCATSARDRAARFLMRRILAQDPAGRRRTHYHQLLDELGDRVPDEWRVLPDGVVPWAFPIHGDAPTRARLAERGVETASLGAGDGARHEAALGLPVHQELRPADLERIVEAVRPPGRPRPVPLRVSVSDDFEALRPEWDRLAMRGDNLFGTWEWTSTWWRHFGAGRQLMLVEARRASGELVAIVPLFASSEGRLRTIRFVGHGLSDQLAPICAPGDELAAARAVRTALDQLVGSWDVFTGDVLPGRHSWAALLGGTLVGREASPVLDVAGLTWDSFVAGRSKNFRRWIRRAEDPLRELPDVRLRMAKGATLAEDFQTLERLHHALWGHRSVTFSEANRGFLSEFVRMAMERGWLRLWLLEVDGQAVAADCLFCVGDVAYVYTGGRDPAWSSWSVGSALRVAFMRSAMEEGVREIRWLRGDEEYKRRFTSRDLGLQRVIVTRGAAANAWRLARTARTTAGIQLDRRAPGLASALGRG